ncbi:MAG: GNAT family N-acetyltransferase [Gammaproteobacteria bacterium]|nr:GNAT family N-acetyltransferase [Gammaproteobacteria bacterium]
MATNSSQARLQIRNARLSDVASIRDLVERVYAGSGTPIYSESMLRGQINRFPEGQFVAEFDGHIVGYCATFIIEGRLAKRHHSWDEITGGGFASRHDPEGDYLYGMEMCVDPKQRGLRIGQRFYDERKKLCIEYGLKGIIFGGRIPQWHKRVKKYESVEHYIQAVENNEIRDPVLSVQIYNGFEVIGVLEDYIPNDRESMGFAVHLLWKNPQQPVEVEAERIKKYGGRLPETIRIATVQYKQRKVQSFEEFLSFIQYFVKVVSDYRADFVVFPELFTLQLLSIEDQDLKPAEAMESLTKYRDRLQTALREMAIRFNVNIIGGSTPTMMKNQRVENICSIYLRDGTIHEQAKIHPTPSESYWWNIEGGNDLIAIDTDCGPIGVLICYDSEFPELARYLIDQGANIIFVPFCTDERQSYLRVRYCCQARAVENQCYVVMSGNVGNLPGVANMDIQYAQSCILTPCDFPFSRDGIAADTTPNVETVAFADLRLDALRTARHAGTVQNLKDRRHDLYQTIWRKQKTKHPA